MKAVCTMPAPENPEKVFEETAKAYADCILDWDTGQKLRNLNFRASAPLTLESYVECMRRATPNGYNEFDAVRVGQVLSQLGVNGNAFFVPAREGSVCVYVRADAWLLEHLRDNAAALHADEADVLDGAQPELRLWWD